MAKPRTSYTPATKSPTTFGKVVKSVTSFAARAKNPTSFGGVAKNPTSYGDSSSDTGGWLLNSTVVTLNSVVYLLSGYTGATPNQSSNKNATTFTAQ